MLPRLQVLKELLAETGAIFLHPDYRMVHVVQLLMDEMFGEDKFINEIIWYYKAGGMPEKMGFGRKHDTILFYARDRSQTRWNPVGVKSCLYIDIPSSRQQEWLQQHNDNVNAMLQAAWIRESVTPDQALPLQPDPDDGVWKVRTDRLLIGCLCLLDEVGNLFSQPISGR